MAKADDPSILDWAAEHNRIVLTHDRATMPDFAHNRIAASQQMPGVFVLYDHTSIQHVIAELSLIDDCSAQEEWSNLVV